MYIVYLGIFVNSPHLGAGANCQAYKSVSGVNVVAGVGAIF